MLNEDKKKTLRDVVLEYSFAVLKAHDGNRSRAADELDITTRTLYNYVSEMRARGWDVPPTPAELQRQDFIKRILAKRQEQERRIEAAAS